MIRIKVDYSLKCKETGEHNIPGEFAIYIKNGIFKPWIEYERYGDYQMACIGAKKLREQINRIPAYF